MKSLILIFLFITVSYLSIGQVTTLGNIGAIGDYSGWNALQPFPFEIRHNGAFPVEFYTNNVERMTIRGQAGFN